VGIEGRKVAGDIKLDCGFRVIKLFGFTWEQKLGGVVGGLGRQSTFIFSFLFLPACVHSRYDILEGKAAENWGAEKKR